MSTTEFGKIVRIARLDADVRLNEMAEALGITPAFLSGMETGRKKISPEWVAKIANYVRNELKADAPNLEAAAAVANKSVSLDGLSPQHQMMVAGFARVKELDPETERRFFELLIAAGGGGK